MAFVYYNPNPQGLHVGDCVIRAVTKATDSTWEQTYMKIIVYGFMMSDMPSANRVWRQYLRDNGFKKYLIPDSCPDCYTVADFCVDHPIGTYILGIDGRNSGHVVTAVNGDWFDTWDSGLEIPDFYWRKE